MRKLTALFLALVLLLSSVALAEGWTCPTCGNEATGNFCNLCGTANPVDEWICPQCKAEAKGNFCNNCGSPRPKGTVASSAASPQVTVAPVDDPNYITQKTIVKNYVGRNLSLCGYYSSRGDRRDEYGRMTLELIMLSPDGTYISPSDEEALEAYKVVAQYPAAYTEFTITKDLDGNKENIGYGEIILVVSKNGESIDAPEIKSVRPSPNKTLQYVRDYRGRTLADAGYTTWSGKRFDQYGPECYVQLIINDEQGNRLNPNDYDNFKYYVVKDQDVEPDTEIICYYNKDSSGKETMSGQTVDLVQLTVAHSAAGVAAMEAEEELRASGALVELYAGTYEIGKDLPAGNYEFSIISDSGSNYVYENKEKLDAKDGIYNSMYNKDYRQYSYLADGMYLKIQSGALKAKRTDFSAEGNEFTLYSGIYHVGVEIPTGSYELKQYGKDIISGYVYQDESSYVVKNGKYFSILDSNDTEYYTLLEGMILKIKSGAVNVSIK